MNKATRALCLALCFALGFAAAGTDYVSKYAGNYIGNTTGAGAGAGTGAGADYTDYYKDFTCPKAVSKANQAISELSDAVKDKESTQWDVFPKMQKLQGLSYYLANGCNTTGLEVANQNKSNQTKAEAKACNQLIALVQSFLDQDGVGSVSNSDYQQSIGLSQQALGFGGDLADNCQVEVAEKKAEEEGESEASAGEEESVVAEEESIVEESANELEDLLIEVTKESDGQKDTYIIYYNPDHKGHADLLLLHGEESEEPSEEEHLPKESHTEAKEIKAPKEAPKKKSFRHKKSPQFYTVNQGGDTDSGSQWAKGDYNKYTEPTQWKKGVYKRYYDAGESGEDIVAIRK